MFSPNARLKRLVTPNWRVKPTAPSARMDAVTSPKPRLRTIWLTAGPSQSRVDGQRGTHDPVVGVDGVAPGRVRPVRGAVLVEHHRAGGADVLDRFARLERRDALGVGADHHGAGGRRGDLGDVRDV